MMTYGRMVVITELVAQKIRAIKDVEGEGI